MPEPSSISRPESERILPRIVAPKVGETRLLDDIGKPPAEGCCLEPRPTLAAKMRRRGRRVAAEAAVIPRPGSMVDQISMP